MSKNVRPPTWVEWEVKEVNKLPNKVRYVINLDEPPPWKVPRADLDALVRDATVILNHAWSARHRIRQLIAGITGAGREASVVFDDLEDVSADEVWEDEPIVPEDRYNVVDHGFRRLDDRAHGADRTWAEAAIEAAARGRIFVHCSSRDYQEGPFSPDRLDDLRRVAAAYDRCYILDVDERWVRGGLPDWLRGADWIVLRGDLRAQLEQLVRELRAVDKTVQIGKAR